jgi:hypothetical protein
MLNPSATPSPSDLQIAVEAPTRELIRRLKSMPAGFSSGAGAKDLWEDFCIHVQRDSPYLEALKDLIQDQIRPIVEGLTVQARLTLWLASEDADFVRHDSAFYSLPDLVPLMGDKAIVRVLMMNALDSAMNFSNTRIRGALNE